MKKDEDGEESMELEERQRRLFIIWDGSIREGVTWHGGEKGRHRIFRSVGGKDYID